jgi:CheY-like chemotaxis protein
MHSLKYFVHGPIVDYAPFRHLVMDLACNRKVCGLFLPSAFYNDRALHKHGKWSGRFKRVLKRAIDVSGSLDRWRMHILLVEDDVVLADGISRVLSGHGMAVDIVHNGNDADAILQRSELAALILDIGLPGMDGFEVVRRLRARNSNIPVLLLTARDAIQDRVHGLELGADDYLVKPFATPELVRD